MNLPFEATDTGLRLFVRAQPRARVEGLEGQDKDAAGRVWLKARVTVPADKGAANVALVALIAKAFGRPKSAVRLTSGETARHKTFVIEGDPDALAAIAAALSEAP